MPGSPDGVEKRGLLTSKQSGAKELLVLRRCSLRVFGGSTRKRGAPSAMLLVTHRFEVATQPGCILELHTNAPPNFAEYAFRCGSEAEAESWRNALCRSLAEGEARVAGFMEFLKQGSTAYKYNYSNSKRMRRHFWVDEEQRLCWGKSRQDEPQTMDLKDCRGIIYGPMTTTFQRCRSMEDPPWCCFSLLFPDRTLDLAVPGDHIDKWFLGLQHVFQGKSSSATMALSEPQFVYRKVFHKLRDSAHRQGLTTWRLVIQTLHSLGGDRGFCEAVKQRGGTNGKVGGYPNGSGECSSRVLSASPLPEAGKESKKARSRDVNIGGGQKGGGTSNGAAARALEIQEEELRKTIEQLEQDLGRQTARLEALRPTWTAQMSKDLPLDGLQEILRSSDGVEWQAEKCSELDKEVLTLKCQNGTMQRQLQAAEKAEKQLKKVAKQFKDTESALAGLEQDVGSAQDSAQTSEKAKQSGKNELERTEVNTHHLEVRVRELEQQLQAGQTGQDMSTVLQDSNKQHEEEIAKIDAEKKACRQKVEQLTQEIKGLEQKHGENERKFASAQGLSTTLVTSLQGLQKEVASLQAAQKQVKNECDGSLRSIADSFLPLNGGVQKISKCQEHLEERFCEINEERKKLHNLVLELKGNIRVFVRVRPMNDKEKTTESASEPTITFAEGTKISVYEENSSRRKWFEYDAAFQPTCTQQQVFEEVKPLATSVLDGFNVCIFAYGQTGSGKTFTMTGNAANPGLNTRVLSELFRIRDDRKVDTEILISLQISEIYNETIKDLFDTTSKGKKLDVKTNSDGSNSVPGLTDHGVQSVEEVLNRMKEAQANRTVMSTDMNDESSRSHSIVQVKTVNTNLKDKRSYIGKINLIDLAGSENVNKSGVSGQGLKEAQNINKSLSALGDVISSLCSKSGHVPYRNSKLTMMLKDSLGGDSKTLMIVQSSPAQTNVTETLSSLNFASRARNVELGKAKRNVKDAG